MKKHFKSYILLSLVIIITLISGLILKYGLEVDKLVLNFYSEQLAQDQIEKVLENQQKWEWVGYAIIPLLILIRSSLVAFCLSVGVFFYDMENKIPFKKFFRIALIGEFVLVLVGFFKFAYFFVLVYGLWKVLDNNYWKSFEITAVSYGTGLVIWLGLVMFLTLNYT